MENASKDANPYMYVLRSAGSLDPNVSISVTRATTLMHTAILHCAKRSEVDIPEHLEAIVTGLAEIVLGLNQSHAQAMYLQQVVEKLERVRESFAEQLSKLPRSDAAA